MHKFITDDQKQEEIKKTRKKYLIIGGIFISIIILFLSYYFYSESHKEIKELKSSNGINKVIQNSSGNITDLKNVEKGAIDSNWGVANTKLERIMADPEIKNNPESLKKAIETLNKETNGIIDKNVISENEIKTHNNKNDCWIVLDGYVFNITELFLKNNTDTINKVIGICGKDGTDLILKNTEFNPLIISINSMKIGILK